MPAAVGSFSIAAIQQAIKNPARGGATDLCEVVEIKF